MSNPRPSVGRGRARGRIRQGDSPGISPVGVRQAGLSQADVTRPGARDYIPPRASDDDQENRLRNQRSKDRKPEVQRYVPRGRRSQGSSDTIDHPEGRSSPTHTSNSKDLSNTGQFDPTNSKNIASFQSEKNDTCEFVGKLRSVNDTHTQNKESHSDNGKSAQTSRQRRIRANQVYVPPARRKDESQQKYKDEGCNSNDSSKIVSLDTQLPVNTKDDYLQSMELKPSSEEESWDVGSSGDSRACNSDIQDQELNRQEYDKADSHSSIQPCPQTDLQINDTHSESIDISNNSKGGGLDIRKTTEHFNTNFTNSDVYDISLVSESHIENMSSNNALSFESVEDTKETVTPSQSHSTGSQIESLQPVIESNSQTHPGNLTTNTVSLQSDELITDDVEPETGNLPVSLKHGNIDSHTDTSLHNSNTLETSQPDTLSLKQVDEQLTNTHDMNQSKCDNSERACYSNEIYDTQDPSKGISCIEEATDNTSSMNDQVDSKDLISNTSQLAMGRILNDKSDMTHCTDDSSNDTFDPHDTSDNTCDTHDASDNTHVTHDTSDKDTSDNTCDTHDTTDNACDTYDSSHSKDNDEQLSSIDKQSDILTNVADAQISKSKSRPKENKSRSLQNESRPKDNKSRSLQNENTPLDNEGKTRKKCIIKTLTSNVKEPPIKSASNQDLEKSDKSYKKTQEIKEKIDKQKSAIVIDSSNKIVKTEAIMAEKEEKGKRPVKKKTVKLKKKKKVENSTEDETLEQNEEDNSQATPNTEAITKSWDNSDEEEDSWDKMFDDEGECLDPNSLQELTGNVGKVKVKKPIINYLNYQPKEPELDYEGMNHVIEIYDFSPDLKTEDLLSAFNQFKSKGFDIKWVDDTHALGVFSSVIAANEALQFTHPLLKVGPLSQACRQSKSKAKRAVEFLQPYKERPETTAVVARRMLTGALGLKTKTSKEQREKEREEKQKLKQAKDKKKKEKQQKNDIWEGTCTSNVSSD